MQIDMVCQAPKCGKVFPAKRKTAKYCSPKCSVRASRAGMTATAPVVASGSGPRSRPGAAMFKATRAELAAAGRVSSSAGQRALLLAKRLDDSTSETGAAVAALCREHASAMDRALRQGAADDPVSALQDEVTARRLDRERKAAGQPGVRPRT